MSDVSQGSLENPSASRSVNHLWKRTSDNNWVHWNGTAWVIISANLVRRTPVDMTTAAATAIPAPVAGWVVSHNAAGEFVIGAGWGVTAGTKCQSTDDFIYISAAWVRTTGTPLSDVVGTLTMSEPDEELEEV